MKRSIKIISCLLIMFCFLFLINIKAITTDTEPPILRNISFIEENKKYTCGDKIYLNIDAYDEVSGIDKEDTSIAVEKICKDKSCSRLKENLKVYYDENDKTYIMVPEVCYNGEYLITSITFGDKLDNFSVYTFNGNNTHFGTTYKKVEEVDKTLKFEIINGSAEVEKWDKKAPTLVSFEVDKRSVKYGEKFTIRANVIDNESGVKSVSVGIVRDNSTSYLDLQNIGNDIYEGEYLVEYGDLYKISYVSVVDNLDNQAFYETKDTCPSEDLINTIFCSLDNIEIKAEKVEGYIPINERDKARPETIKINKSKYSVPSYGEIELTVSTNVLLDDRVTITFTDDNKNEIDVEIYNVGNNTYKGDIKINQYVKEGKYKLATIRLYRKDKIKPYYYVYTNDLGNKYDQSAKTGDLEFDLEFEVYANNIPDVITGTQAENLLESIKNAKDDAIIYVDATNNSIIKKEVFEAIKDTNKELHIESSGIEWIFKGKDITNPKQIDTSISVLFDYDYNKTNMKDYIDKSVVILFKDNGELPGISTIRIKLDYVFRSYIGNKIYVYYYDENSKFEDVTGKELEISENGYFEFNIKHNSTYIMSSNKPDSKYISESKELVKINTDIKEKKDNVDYKLIYISLVVVAVLIIVIAIIINLNNKKKKINNANNIDNDVNNIDNN